MAGNNTIRERRTATDAAASTLWRRAATAARVIQVRLRFILVFGVAFVVVGNWATLRNYWDRLTRPTLGAPANAAVSGDTEFFCPMDPGVVSDWAGKCGICNMALVRRPRGEAVQLPTGVVARMQLSPYRLQLAGVRTAKVDFQPLVRELASVGIVAGRAIVECEFPEREIGWLNVGIAARITSDSRAGRPPFEGSVVWLDDHISPASRSLAARIEIDDARGELRGGMFVSIRVEVPASQLEPFRSMPSEPPAPGPINLREVFVCPDHPDVVRLDADKCPRDKKPLERRRLTEHQRLNWWCPMHPEVAEDKAGGECKECGGMELIPRVLAFKPLGRVLAVPETAVIDTGTRKVVFVDRGGGMFDAVEVELGPRCGEFFPVVRGLEPGQKVASAGAFLLDAETRLNPSVGVGYFGATEKTK